MRAVVTNASRRLQSRILLVTSRAVYPLNATQLTRSARLLIAALKMVLLGGVRDAE
jgi:hypothetical protein